MTAETILSLIAVLSSGPLSSKINDLRLAGITGFGIENVACPAVEIFVNQPPRIISLDVPADNGLGVLPNGDQIFGNGQDGF